MCTARLLTVSQHALSGDVLAQGCTCLRGVPAQGGVPARGCTCQGSTCQGVYLLGVPAQGVPAQVLPPCEQNDRWKNITLPQTSFAGGNKVENKYEFGTVKGHGHLSTSQ